MARFNKRTQTLLISVIIFSFILVPVYFSVSAKEHTEALVQVPFEFNGRVIIPLRVNDSGELNIILDSGMGHEALGLLHSELGEELGLEYVQTIRVGGAGSGEPKTASVATGVKISLSEIDIHDITVAVNEENREESIHTDDGLIGSLIFGSYVVEIDFDRSQLCLFDPAEFEPENGWEEIPLIMERNAAFLETSISLDGKTRIPVRLLVDLGARHALALSVDPANKIIPPENAVENLLGTGVRGDVFGPQGRIAGLTLSSCEVKDVIVGFADEDSIPLPASCDGNLGVGTLRRFNVIFDYPHSRMFLKPNAYHLKSFEVNMAGIAMRNTFEGPKIVSYVVENSPAFDAGIKKGDRITVLNGRKIEKYTYTDIYETFREEGRKIKLVIERGPETLKFRFKLRRIL